MNLQCTRKQKYDTLFSPNMAKKRKSTFASKQKTIPYNTRTSFRDVARSLHSLLTP